MIEVGGIGVAMHHGVTALAGAFAVTVAALNGRRLLRRRGPGRRGPTCLAAACVATLALAGGLLLHHGLVAPVLGMVDGADETVCCFDARNEGVLTSADGHWASRGGRLVDLRSGTVQATAGGEQVRVRPARTMRHDGGSAYFGDERSPTRAARFSGPQPLALQFGDGTEIKLVNPRGNCAVIAEEGGVAAVVISDPERTWLDAVLPLRGAGTIDFVELRTGRTLRSVTVARLDGFTCKQGLVSGATLVGLRNGARWVLSQEHWIKIFEVPVPVPGRQPVRALALAAASP